MNASWRNNPPLSPKRATLGDAYREPDEDEDFESGAAVGGADFAGPVSADTESAAETAAEIAPELAAAPEARAARRGPSLKARAVGLLSRREYSRKELSQRLALHAPDEETLTALLDGLQREGWLSDERYARSQLNQRSARQGERRIIGDLRRQGVADELLDTLSEDLRATEYERAVQVWRKRFEGKALPDTPKEYARQARFLAARGFAGHVVGKVLKLALRGQSEPEGMEGFEDFSD